MLGAWCVRDGSWLMSQGTWFMAQVLDACVMVHGSRLMSRGQGRPDPDLGPRSVAPGLQLIGPLGHAPWAGNHQAEIIKTNHKLIGYLWLNNVRLHGFPKFSMLFSFFFSSVE